MPSLFKRGSSREASVLGELAAGRGLCQLSRPRGSVANGRGALPIAGRSAGARGSWGIVGALGSPAAAAEDAPRGSQGAGQGATAGDRTLGVVAAARLEAAADPEGGPS